MDDIHVLVVDTGDERAAQVADALADSRIRPHFVPFSEYIVSVSPDEPFDVLFASRPFPGITTAEAMKGQPLTDFVPDVLRATLWAALRRAAQGLQEVATTPDGVATGHAALIHTEIGTQSETLAVSITIDASGPKSAAGQPTLVVTARDLAERAQAEAQREALERQVHQVQRLEAVGTLAGGIAHDFNNILQAVTGFAGMVLDDLPEGHTGRELLEHVMTAGHRGQDLVQRILTLSRTSKVKTVETIELEPLLQKVVDLARAAVPSSITMRLDKETRVTNVRGDRAELTQVFMNLVTNAYQAIGADSGSIIVTTKIDAPPAEAHPTTALARPPVFIRVDVADTGHGMTDEVIDQCFDPFFTTRRVGEGTGLGLSVSRTIIRAHGGAVNVGSQAASHPDNQVDKGTRFSVYLPVMSANRSATKPERKQYRTAPAAAAGAKLLVVDDEPMIAMYLEQTLSRKGYLVTRCADVGTAWLAWEQASSKFDAVVTDFAMPGGTGLELAAQLREASPKLPIILLTGYANPDTESGCRALDVRLLVKPVTSRVLLRTLADAFAAAASAR